MERIAILEGRLMSQIKMIPSCFGLTDPSEDRCFKKGRPLCYFPQSCLVYTGEFFDIHNAEEWDENNLKAEVIRIWENRNKLEEKLKLRLKEAIRTANKSEYKDIVQPTAKKGTATYYAESFWLKMGGTIRECAEYVERKFKACNAYKL